MANDESMDYTHSHPSTIASLSCVAQHSPVPYTFLKIATIPAYYGISMAIPRYIAMQLWRPQFNRTLIMHANVYDQDQGLTGRYQNTTLNT